MNSVKIFLHVLHFSLREHKTEIEIGSQLVIGYPWPPILLFRGYSSNSISFSRYHISAELRVQSVPDNGVLFPEAFSGGSVWKLDKNNCPPAKLGKNILVPAQMPRRCLKSKYVTIKTTFVQIRLKI